MMTVSFPANIAPAVSAPALPAICHPLPTITTLSQLTTYIQMGQNVTKCDTFQIRSAPPGNSPSISSRNARPAPQLRKPSASPAAFSLPGQCPIPRSPPPHPNPAAGQKPAIFQKPGLAGMSGVGEKDGTFGKAG